MLASFPPFPSPNPATMKRSPLDTVPIPPSPPSSAGSSEASTPAPSTPLSSSPSISSQRSANRSRSRSAARKSASHTRIVKQQNHTSESTTPSAPRTPPVTPPAGGDRLDEPDTTSRRGSLDSPSDSHRQNHHRSSLRSHHYEDAVRIACGAWGETGDTAPKKKSVSFDKDIST